MSSYTPSPTILLTTLVLLAVTSLLTMGLFSRRRVEKFDPADKVRYRSSRAVLNRKELINRGPCHSIATLVERQKDSASHSLVNSLLVVLT